jgi:hypothetical protein
VHQDGDVEVLTFDETNAALIWTNTQGKNREHTRCRYTHYCYF